MMVNTNKLGFYTVFAAVYAAHVAKNAAPDYATKLALEAAKTAYAEGKFLPR